MTTLNRSVEEHLRRHEQTRTTRVLVRLSAAGAGLYLLAALVGRRQPFDG